MRPRPPHLVATMFLAAVVFVMAAAGPASAHAVVVDQTPAPGSLLDSSPDAVTITFNEPVEVSGNSIVVINQNGESVADPARAEGPTVEATIPGSLEGWHAVSWHVVSADGHPVSGAWTFRVGTGSSEVPEGLVDQAREGLEASPVARIAWVQSQWASTLAVMVLVGTLLVLALAPPVPTVLRLAGGAAGLGFVTSILAAAVNGPQVGPNVGWFDGPASGAYLARAALVAVAALVLLGRRWWPGGQGRLVFGAGVLAAGALAVAVTSGHAGSRGGVALVAVIIHLVVAAGWLGAVPAVFLAVRHGEQPARSVLYRFSKWAGWSLAAVVISGGVGAWVLSGGPGSVANNWALVLVIKLVLIGMAVATGAWTRWKVLPQRNRRSGARAPLLFESLVLVAVVAASIALVHNGPPREVTTAGPIVMAETFDDLNLQVIVDPGRVGTNDLHIYITDSTGMPTAVEEATLEISSKELGIGTIVPELSDLGAGHYFGRIDDLGLPGTWELRLRVRTDPFTQLDLADSIRIRR